MSRRPGAPVPQPVERLPLVHRAADTTSALARSKVRAGVWERAGHGAYLPVEGGDPFAVARRRALAAVAAVAHGSRAPVVFSHGTAALLWGLTLWRLPERVHLLHPSRAGGDRDRGIARHTSAIDGAEIAEVAGVRVTSLARTVLDCVAVLPPLDGLVVTDSALAAGLAPSALAERVLAAAGARHIAKVRAVTALGDDGSESAYESASRFVVLRAGLPRPDTQVRTLTHLGEVWTDWGWPTFGVLAEYDGRDKYDDRRAFMAEKRRHDAIVEAGRRVVRVVREDVDDDRLLLARLGRVLPRAVVAAARPVPALGA
ncbi:hypothetical protein KIN34_02345 [Cellulomonas sp. DKR-3]|uniref:Transcriptional regulator, AbiEi antitoxin, Type IV TA system n=1 Tax=Cellulomonas fulva TaxID=2835530 RepID=A0ABS5TVJ3_9CELL|nr:hypothetical protein [Cellulomonas fulva]MBT0993132.1 hypothetical protein [Cellulomonas fulva]